MVEQAHHHLLLCSALAYARFITEYLNCYDESNNRIVERYLEELLYFIDWYHIVSAPCS